jgi:TonB-linked SusC/RagA family outer membrane protein
MEKKQEQCLFFRQKLFKLLRVMKLLSVILLIGAMHVSAAVKSQQRVTLKYDKIRVEDALEQVRKNSSYELFFSMHEIETDKIISLDIDNEYVVDALKKILGDKYKYNVVDNVIIIKPMAKISSQQKKTEIKGQVVDEKGKPMPGVTVQLEGVSMGTSTDIKGKFKLQLPIKKGVLIISFVGYKTQKVKFQEGKELKIKLVEERSNLDEVTVVAYGQVKKREMTGSVSVVKGDDLKGLPTPSLSNLLQGRVAGMDVTNISGAPGGGGTQITLRGYNSLGIEAGRRFSNPLWVIDGVPMTTFTSPVTGTNGLADINPEIIESIHVLKDASATSLYGARAANGVILVTTKKGRKNQKGKFSVNFSHTYSVLPEYPTIYGGKGERDYRISSRRIYKSAYLNSDNVYVYPTSYRDVYGTSGTYDKYWGNGKVYGLSDGDQLQDSLNSFYNNSTNFFKELYRVGKVTNANIQTYGGSERMSYSIGLGYYDETGIVIGTGFNRINLMGNFMARPNDKLTVSLNTYLSMADRSRGERGSGLGSGQDIELIPGKAHELSTLLPLKTDATKEAINKFKSQKEKNITYRLRTSFKLEYQIMKDLNFSNAVSIDYSQNNRNSWLPGVLDYYNESKSIGEIARNKMFLNESLLNYKKTINEDHNIDVMLGLSFQRDEFNYIAGSAKNGPSDFIHYVGKKGWPDVIERYEDYYEALKNYTSDFSEKKMNSYFGRLNYNYKKRYMLTATIRRDGSSVFGENLKWATFPSYAAGWNFSQEDFMRWADFLDFGKVRVSYGKSGNTFKNPYLSYGLLVGGKPHEGKPTIEPVYKDGYYNPNLSWEETDQWDIGIDLNLMNYRLSITADYYNRYTHEMLYKVPLPGNYSGYSNVWKNAAAISNEGLELEIKYDIFRDNNDYWRMSFNIAKNWNRLKESWNNKDFYDSNEKKNYILGRKLNGIIGLRTNGYIQSEGDIVAFYNSYGEIDHINPRSSTSFYYPGNTKFIDANGDYQISYLDYSYLGSSLPEVYGGIVNEVRWKNFDLNMLFSYSFGRDMINATKLEGLQAYNELVPIFNDLRKVSFWEKEGDNTTYPIASFVNYNRDFMPAQDRYVETVHYIKLKTLTLGYTLPKHLFKIRYFDNVRLFFSGENLFTITNYSGMDPETVSLQSGIDKTKNYPLARKLTLGLTIKL